MERTLIASGLSGKLGFAPYIRSVETILTAIKIPVLRGADVRSRINSFVKCHTGYHRVSPLPQHTVVCIILQ